MSEPIKPEKILEELRSLGDEATTLLIAKLLNTDDRVKGPAEVKFMCQEEIDHLFDTGEFNRLFNERPQISVRVESSELFAVKGINEPAKRMIQLINIQKGLSLRGKNG